MNESFETVELTEGGDLHGVGEPGENEQHVFTRYAISHFYFFLHEFVSEFESFTCQNANLFLNFLNINYRPVNRIQYKIIVISIFSNDL